jgi:hypothetical protein
MLDHPWLSMPDEFDYKMSDLEYKKYRLRQTVEGINQDFLSGGGQRQQTQGQEGSTKTSKRQADYQEYCPGARIFEGTIGDLCDGDSEQNGADCEDNVSSYLDSVLGAESTKKGKKQTKAAGGGSDDEDSSSSDDDEDALSLSFVSENNR